MFETAETTIKEMRVTVIIPIFNAYEDTLACLNSVVKHTDSRHDILLIDDASPDSRIQALTAQFCDRYENFRCLTNPENLGFVKSCNRGFSESRDRDVVLLNSDTIVIANWLEQLIAAAYSDATIATVTPLTNNGTICSIPQWLEYNEIPDGYTVESFGELIGQTSLRQYPRIPTAVGFCMYVKQEVIQKIGYFDDVTFGRGYGEENDFCCRASEAGYFHIIDDVTFVYHAGSKSFSTDKEKLIQQNYEKLKLKHKNYFQEVAEFVARDPMRGILKNIDLQLTLEKIRKSYSILILLHNSIDEAKNHPLGGTERHCKALADRVNDEITIGVFYRDIPRKLLRLDLYDEGQKIQLAFPYPVELGFSTLTEPHFKEFFPKFLNYFQFNLIHIHHLIAFPLSDVYETCRQIEIPYVVSLHDYHHICPNYNLLDWKSSFCFEKKDENYCRKCISDFGYSKNYRELWAAAAREGLQRAELAIAPSETAKGYLLREYPSLDPNRVKVIGHGVYPQAFIEEVSSLRKQAIATRLGRTFNNAAPLTVAFVGALKTHKGSKIIKELFEKVASDPSISNRFSFLILGQIDFQLSFSETVAIAQIVNYEPQDLAKLLTPADVAVFPNIWPETYCLTVDEALLAGVPAIATSLGAPSERVKAWQVGWVGESVSADEILALLLKISDCRDLLQPVLKNLLDLKVKSYEEMASEYERLYQQLSSKENYDKSLPALDNVAVLEAYLQDIPTPPPNSEIVTTGDMNESYVFKLARKLGIVWIKYRFPKVWAGLKNIFWSRDREFINKVTKTIRWILKV